MARKRKQDKVSKRFRAVGKRAEAVYNGTRWQDGVVMQSDAKSLELKLDKLNKGEKNPVVIANKPGYWPPDLHQKCNACGKMTSEFKEQEKASRTCNHWNKVIKKHQYHFNCVCGHDLC